MQWLDARSSGPFAPLALSYTRDILLDPGLGDRRLAVGTTLLGLPAGLGIASLAVEGGDSWVESLAVSRMFEGRGIATALLQTLEAALRERGCTVETGEFGAMSEVELVNDGPTTIWLER